MGRVKRYFKTDENGEKVEIPFNEYHNNYVKDNKDIIYKRNKEKRDKKLDEEEKKRLLEILQNEIFNNNYLIKKYNLNKRNKDRMIHLLTKINNIDDTKAKIEQYSSFKLTYYENGNKKSKSFNTLEEAENYQRNLNQ